MRGYMEGTRTYRITALSNLLGFSAESKKSSIYNKVEKGEYITPFSHKSITDAEERRRKPREWAIDQVHEIGKDYGFLSMIKGNKYPSFTKSPPGVITVITKKGGTIKTTKAFNIARTAAMQGKKTIIIGLDVQCDISRLLKHYAQADQISDPDELDKLFRDEKGLFEIFEGTSKLHEVIHKTDLPLLHYIPETENLVNLSERLETIPRREYWLKENVIDILKELYDLIVVDCPPTAGRLVYNVIVTTDLIVSPVACQINNWRNFKRTIRYFIQVADELKIPHIRYLNIITSLKNNALSKSIKTWYQKNLQNVAPNAVKDSVIYEEANAQHISLLELKPTGSVAEDYKENLIEIFQQFIYAVEDRNDREYKDFLNQQKNFTPASFVQKKENEQKGNNETYNIIN